MLIRLSAQVPEVQRVDANIESDLWDRAEVRLTFVVDEYEPEVERRIVSLIVDFMLDSELPIDFLILPERVIHGAPRFVVYERASTPASA